MKPRFLVALTSFALTLASCQVAPIATSSFSSASSSMEKESSQPSSSEASSAKKEHAVRKRRIDLYEVGFQGSLDAYFIDGIDHPYFDLRDLLKTRMSEPFMHGFPMPELTLSHEAETYLIQEKHLPIYHLYCMCLENEFFGE